jgi:acyl-CoA dehydrogenase
VPITAEDLAALLQQIDRFCRQRVEPLLSPPEPPQQAQPALDELTAAAREVGIVGSGPDRGIGLWEEPGEEGLRRLAVEALARLGQVSAGAAFHLHQIGLGRHLALALGRPGGTVVPCLTRGIGLGRGALVRWLRGEAPQPEDAALLGDLLPGEGRPAVLQAGGNWDGVVAPHYDAASHGVRWQLWPRDSLSLTPHQASHGLDETPAWTLSTFGGGEMAAMEGEAAGELLFQVLQLHGLALMAIGLGAVRGGLARARDYAGLRVQGGSVIADHPAVQLMLGEAASTVRAVELLLDALAVRPLAPASLAATLAARACVHPLLCAAANRALQTFGGLGYMREVGLERVVRDCNCLRLMSGTPTDLRLFVAEWERAQ